MNLPKKLNKEPLIDIIFEMRFVGLYPASDILPGIFFSKLEGQKSSSRLPVDQIPKAMRDADPNLQFAPVACLDWDQFRINIGDRNIAVNCKLPYPGWAMFKSVIIKILDILNDLSIVQSVQRYSMKYIDLINPAITQTNFLNFDLTIANVALKKEAFQLRIEVPKDNFINVIQLASPATVKLLDGVVKEGVMVDIDTICNVENITLQNLLTDFSTKLEQIHQINKALFFDCLTPEAITNLEPIYD